MEEPVKRDPLKDYQQQLDEWRRQRAEVEEQLAMLRFRLQDVRDHLEMLDRQREELRSFRLEMIKKRQRLLWVGFGRW